MDRLEKDAAVTTLEQPDLGRSQASSIPHEAAASKLPLRQLGINLNHWYVVAQSKALSIQPLAVTLWHQPIVLYRDRTGTPIAVEDRCPHRQVKLSEGTVEGDNIACAYHGWQFAPDGSCAHVPYLEPQQKLPTCQLRQYPVQERDGFIWLFPGEAALADTVAPMGVSEWEHLNFIGSLTTIDVQAHYSFLIENLMDMYHGHLHGGAQVWANPVLAGLEADDTHVHAHYDAESYYRIDKIWSASQLIFPSLRQLHPEPLDVYYHYPHWRSTLGDDFVIYCLFCPVSETHTRAYLLHFTSLERFPKLHKTPLTVRRFVKRAFNNSASFVLRRLVREDVLMLEQEQQAFDQHPTYRGPELNRALTAVQQLIRQQAEGSGE
ncbi:aromatic ring-hydroxylating oxygenase subunit alpha [Phormidium tenue]|uniref:aromatic ring-hydroxylating dioxygenase subunit alpha n=1 Tax=Phormidium tenue TaxID=126344 RepID=UPI000A04D796|nr:aromatic ring-hydroxylating dioxygenase subunit alpha [Phormidium tenue]MBD2231376.1 aromatic ring-hydroxylating dioxygenase subunit alpha [Phormidium tenue FACHB-1052]